jgi:hypothetical protein
MNKFLFVGPNGLVAHIIGEEPETLYPYEEGQAYDGCVCRRVNADVDDATILSTWHWNGAEFATHLPRDATAFVWDSASFSYKEPVVPKFLFVTAEGLVAYTASPGFDGAYVDGEMYGDCIARQTDTKVDDATILSTWHWNGTGFATHELKTNPHFIWDPVSFAYKEPDNYIETVRAQAMLDVNKEANRVIIARYPQHKQANMTARAVELMSINQVGSEEWLSIQAAWGWVKSVRDASNVANTAIALSATIADIRAKEQEFQETIAQL